MCWSIVTGGVKGAVMCSKMVTKYPRVNLKLLEVTERSPKALERPLDASEWPREAIAI